MYGKIAGRFGLSNLQIILLVIFDSFPLDILDNGLADRFVLRDVASILLGFVVGGMGRAAW